MGLLALLCLLAAGGLLLRPAASYPFYEYTAKAGTLGGCSVGTDSSYVTYEVGLMTSISYQTACMGYENSMAGFIHDNYGANPSRLDSAPETYLSFSYFPGENMQQINWGNMPHARVINGLAVDRWEAHPTLNDVYRVEHNRFNIPFDEDVLMTWFSAQIFTVTANDHMLQNASLYCHVQWSQNYSGSPNNPVPSWSASDILPLDRDWTSPPPGNA